VHRFPTIGWQASALWLLGIVVAGWNPPATAAGPRVSPEAVKAALVLKFSEFTTWPTSARPVGGGGLVVGFYKAPELIKAARSLVAGDKGGHVELVEVDSTEKALSCHVVYFGKWDTDARNALEKLRTRPVLTIGEGAGFLEADGIVGFEFQEVKESVRPAYYINIPAMDRARILLDPRVLKNRLQPAKEP
jgi:hypothetical protein